MKNKVKVVLCTLAIVTLFSFSTVQTLVYGLSFTKTISGYVKDVHGVPIADARVDLIENLMTFPPSYATVKTVYTNSQGYYTMTYTGSGRLYSLEVSKSNYVTQSVPIMWRDNNPVTLNFQLLTIFPIIVTFQGTVYDDFDFNPRSGVTVKLYKQSGSYWNLERITTTNQVGFYDFTSDPAQSTYPTYKVEISGNCKTECKLYYPTSSKTITANFYADMIRKYAVVVGVPFYEDEALENLYSMEHEYWNDYLTNYMNFDQVKVLDHTENYDGRATEANVKLELNNMISDANENDVIVFTFFGHGGTGPKLCMWDYGDGGKIFEGELYDIFKNAVAERVFIYLHSCVSGGFINGLDIKDLTKLPNKTNFLIVTSNDEHNSVSTSVALDFDNYENDAIGTWTYDFLIVSLGYFTVLSNTIYDPNDWDPDLNLRPEICLETIYWDAYDDVFSGGFGPYPMDFEVTNWEGEVTDIIPMDPQMFDGNTSNPFYL